MPRMTPADYQAYLMKRGAFKHQALSEGVELEGKLHADIIAHCLRQWPQWPYIHARMDRESTIAEGAPDFVLFLPNGKVLLLECKRRNGKVSEAQAAWHHMASLVGHQVHVVRSIEDVLKLV